MQKVSHFPTAFVARIATILVLGAMLFAASAAHAQKEDRWEPAIQAFEAQDRDAMPPEGAVLFVGSSSIRVWDLDESFSRSRDD